MWNDRYSAAGLTLAGRANFDPATLMMAGAAGLQAVGAITSANATIAGGNYAKLAGQLRQNEADYEAEQQDQNATTAFANSQREMLDKKNQTRLLQGKTIANAAASGVDAGVGSAATTVGNIAKRGSYEEAMDLFNGTSVANNLRDQAAATRYGGLIDLVGGEEQQSAAQTKALGTLASSAGSMFSTYGKSLQKPS